MDEKEIVNLAKQQNEYVKRRFSTKYSQYKYKLGQQHFLHNFTYALLWIYFIVAAFYLGILLVGPKRQKFSYRYKVVALIIIVLFPYIITPIEYFVIRAITFIIETLVGNVFQRDDYQYLVDYTFMPTFFSY
jgi:hypothetical protein